MKTYTPEQAAEVVRRKGEAILRPFRYSEQRSGCFTRAALAAAKAGLLKKERLAYDTIRVTPA